jgi:hypothetical protein
MQTERVTFLTSPDHKAALDAFAKDSGMSVGHMLREASSHYMAEAPLNDDEKLAILVGQLNEAVPAIAESFDRMTALMDHAYEALRQLRAERAALRAQ